MIVFRREPSGNLTKRDKKERVRPDVAMESRTSAALEHGSRVRERCCKARVTYA
jgi:hypothetical protein